MIEKLPALRSTQFSKILRSNSLAIVGGPNQHLLAEHRDKGLDDAFKNVVTDLVNFMKEKDTTVFLGDNVFQLTFDDESSIRLNLQNILRNHLRKIPEKGQEFYVFFYFTGHGLIDAAGDFVISTNSTTEDVDGSTLHIPKLIELISRSLEDYENCKKIMFVDSCRSESASNRTGMFQIFGETKKNSTRNWFFCSSSSAHEMSWRRDGDRYTYFSSDFLDILQDGIEHNTNSGLHLGEIYSELRARAARRAQNQRPRRVSSLDDQETVIFLNQHVWRSADNLVTLAASIASYRNEIEKFCSGVHFHLDQQLNLISQKAKEIESSVAECRAAIQDVENLNERMGKTIDDSEALFKKSVEDQIVAGKEQLETATATASENVRILVDTAKTTLHDKMTIVDTLNSRFKWVFFLAFAALAVSVWANYGSIVQTFRQS